MTHPCVSSPPPPQSSSTAPAFFYLYVEVRSAADSKLSHCLHPQSYWSWLASSSLFFFFPDSPISGSSPCALIQKLPLSYLSKCQPRPQVVTPSSAILRPRGEEAQRVHWRELVHVSTSEGEGQGPGTRWHPSSHLVPRCRGPCTSLWALPGSPEKEPEELCPGQRGVS